MTDYRPLVRGVSTPRVSTSYRPHPRLIEMPGLPAAVVTVPDPADVAELEADLTALRAEVDVLVAFFHFGVSSQRTVVDYQRTLAHAAIDAGADVVFGSHAHVVQPIEEHRGRPIFYGLGQVIFGWEFVARERHPGQPGLLVELERTGSVSRWSAQFVVPHATSLEPRIVPLSEVPAEVEHLATSSSAVRFVDARIVVGTSTTAP